MFGMKKWNCLKRPKWWVASSFLSVREARQKNFDFGFTRKTLKLVQLCVIPAVRSVNLVRRPDIGHQSSSTLARCLCDEEQENPHAVSLLISGIVGYVCDFTSVFSAPRWKILPCGFESHPFLC